MWQAWDVQIASRSPAGRLGPTSIYKNSKSGLPFIGHPCKGVHNVRRIVSRPRVPPHHPSQPTEESMAIVNIAKPSVLPLAKGPQPGARSGSRR